jgi:hypothetical protein
MRDHANATPPWSCTCDCHKKPFREKWEKDMRNTQHRETFQTHAEAEAFIRGIEFVDNDHVSTEGLEPELDDYGQPEYAVYVTEFA